MKTKTALISTLLTFMMALFIINSCSKDEPVPLKLVSLAAGSIDLNGATSPNDVPVNPVITATFNTNVDPTTATSSTITLVQNYDGANIELNISVDGKTVTISPKSELGHGALYQLTITEGLKSKDGEPLVSLTRSFTTEGTFVPSGQVAHWGFENNANDDVGTWNAKSDGVVDISYVNSRNAAAGKAASFNGTTSIIEIPNGDQLINTHDFTISFWVKTNSADKTSGHFVLGLGAFYGIQFEIFGGYDGAKFAIRYELGDGST
ncbi:MAG TPA: Ig-like domain-containing protein, partial [Bacteroidales bacterium]|nr:Ig-like domain-containing protein [Bacteroidales bacterium]